MLLVSCLVLLTVRAAQGAASEVCRGSEPCSQWRVLMPQLRLTAFRLTGFIRWSCSCEAKAPARAPGGAGFKGQRPLRTVSPPLEANSASPACYCWSHPRCSSLSLSAVSERAVRFSPAFLSSGGVVCCWLAAWCCSQCEPRKARRVKFVVVPSPAVEHGEF